MKVLNIVLLLMVMMAVGCKTQKIAPKPEPLKSETVVKSTEIVTANPSVRSKEERVSAANGEAKDLGSKKYYIILGSYKIFEGAQKFKKQLMAENFFPGILFAAEASDGKGGKGMYRVMAESFDDETAARSRVSELRQKYPQYNDLWLLINKQ